MWRIVKMERQGRTWFVIQKRFLGFWWHVGYGMSHEEAKATLDNRTAKTTMTVVEVRP